jgi:hypothetical protein
MRVTSVRRKREAKLQAEDMNSEHRVRVGCSGPDKGEPATGVQARAVNKGATEMDGLDIDQTLSGGFMSSLRAAISNRIRLIFCNCLMLGSVDTSMNSMFKSECYLIFFGFGDEMSIKRPLPGLACAGECGNLLFHIVQIQMQ